MPVLGFPSMSLAVLALEPQTELQSAKVRLGMFLRYAEPKDRQFRCGHCCEIIRPVNSQPDTQHLYQDVDNQASG
jgi:hypothetical protein